MTPGLKGAPLPVRTRETRSKLQKLFGLPVHFQLAIAVFPNTSTGTGSYPSCSNESRMSQSMTRSGLLHVSVLQKTWCRFKKEKVYRAVSLYPTQSPHAVFHCRSADDWGPVGNMSGRIRGSAKKGFRSETCTHSDSNLQKYIYLFN